MAESKAGRPRILHRRIVQDTTKNQREHEEQLLKDKSLADLLKTGLKEGLARAPDIALLGGGFYLGYEMNMRPGIEIPGPLGPFFLGLPDFGGVVKDLKEEVKRAQANVDRDEAQRSSNEEEEAACRQAANESFMGTPDNPGHRDTFRLGREELECLVRNPSKSFLKTLADAKAELQKHRIAQGFLFLIMTWTISRPGFFQGIGEIIPG